MKWTTILVVLPTLVLAAWVDVKNSLGYPLPNATVCTPSVCVKTNASGMAHLPDGPIEIYIDGILTWKATASENTTVLITFLDDVPIKPLPADGVVELKIVKLENGTYRNIQISFSNNKLTRVIPVGNINYPVEIYIKNLEGEQVNFTVRTFLWELEVDLEKAGILKKCEIAAYQPVSNVEIIHGNTPIATGRHVNFYLIRGVNYTGIAETEIVAPNGSLYAARFRPEEYCGRTLLINASRVTIRVVDSFGAVRSDWVIVMANKTYRGEAQFWALLNTPYEVYVDAVHTKKRFVFSPTHPAEMLIVNIPTSYIVLSYQQPPRHVYIYGNYTYAEPMPRRVEVPPGAYQVIVDWGGVNTTYVVEVRPGEVKQLVVTPPPLPKGDSGQVNLLPILAAFGVIVVVYILRKRLAAVYH
ncbi:MAG: hypothetical protein ABWK05_01805 [Pyrobaculum sp.]